ncbi:hypothetical protein SASPL_152880 [Salvia splendens]|uniref:Uncharacterized protein n=1 Tax=Salvia splendens TaxID=180675 RepID=A0A8X8Z187_SALSN|nr:hypothetical protein SASPL_152880 [Salvia splendens]
MAATVKTAWALDAEENESELLQQQEEMVAAPNGHSETADFPSLALVKTKKKKKQVLTLQEFSTYSAAKSAAFQAKGLTTDELMALSTGPRERTTEELDRNKLGGGFRSYGGGMRDEQPRRQGTSHPEQKTSVRVLQLSSNVGICPSNTSLKNYFQMKTFFAITSTCDSDEHLDDGKIF